MVVEIHQSLYDPIRIPTYIRIKDADNDFSFAGKRQHMEIQLGVVAVQLKGQMVRFKDPDYCRMLL